MMPYVVVVTVYGYPWPPYLLVLLFIVGLLKELLAPLWGFLQVVLTCLCVIFELQVVWAHNNSHRRLSYLTCPPIGGGKRAFLCGCRVVWRASNRHTCCQLAPPYKRYTQIPRYYWVACYLSFNTSAATCTCSVQLTATRYKKQHSF